MAVPTDISRFRYYALSRSEPIEDNGLNAWAGAGYLTIHLASIPLRPAGRAHLGGSHASGVGRSRLRSHLFKVTIAASGAGSFGLDVLAARHRSTFD